MDVDAPQRGQLQNIHGEDFAVGRHHNELGSQLSQLLQGASIPQSGGLEYRNSHRQGILLHRGRQQLHAAVFGLVRLGKDSAHLMAILHQAAQRGDGKVRGAHKDDSHASSSSMASNSSTV